MRENRESRVAPGPMQERNSAPAEKSENFFSAWGKLLRYVRNYWPVLLIAIISAALGNVLTVMGPARLGEMTNVILDGMDSAIDMQAVTRIGLTLIGLYGIGGALSLAQGWVMVDVTQKVTKRLRTHISDKINKLPMTYYSQTTVGDTLSRVTNDVDTIGQSLNMTVSNLVSSGTLLIGSLVMMLLTNGVLTLTAVGATVVGLVLMGLIMRNSQRYFVRQQEHLGEINGHIEETYAGHPIVKAYNGEAEARDEFIEMNTQLRDSGFKAQALSGLMMPIMSFIGNFGYVAVCVVGSALALTGQISFGVVVAFIIYVRYFTQPLAQIARAVQTLQSGAAAGERVFDFLEAEEMADESYKTETISQPKGRVEFSHVNFSYDPSEELVIKNFSTKAEPGQKIAIVGHSGAGKTTLVNLLMRFYDIDSGEIYIDGVPISAMSREEVRDQFCMVLQDTWVFEGTVRENLIYNTENVSEEKMIEACEAVGIDHFIRTLPQGYDTVLDESANLSQGQRQQLTIARAIIADKPMLILDEATSSVDTRTELEIQRAMETLMEGRTTFVIAHRLSTVKNADLILVMDDGEIVESGTHDELMTRDGFYKELYNSQFEKAS